MDTPRFVGTVVVLALLGAVLSPSRVSAQSIRLNGDLAPELRTGNVSEHRFTLDGTRLVYRADRAASGVNELFGVPADGSTPSVRLNGPLPPGGQVRFGVRVGAGNRAVYVADQTTQGVLELFSVPADASTSPVRLSPNPAFAFWVNPAGDYVYFRDSLSSTTLQRVPIDGSAAPSVVASCPTFPLNVLFSADGVAALVVMLGDLDTYRLYGVPAAGGSLVQLHQTASGNLLNDIRFAPDGVHVVFEEVALKPGFFPNYLFSVPFDGSGPAVQLSLTPWYDIGGYRLDASSVLDRLVYLEGTSVFSIAFDGSQRATLSPSGWDSDPSYFGAPPILAVRGPDVVFEAHTAAGRSLLRAPLDGSQAGVPLFAPSSIEYAYDPEILASGTVLYRADGLHAVPLAGGTPLLLTPNMDVYTFIVHPNELEAAFISTSALGKDELFLVPVDGSQAPRKLNAPLLHPAGDVQYFSFSFTADGLSVAYVADPLVDNLNGVFRAPLDGLGPVVQYNEPVSGSAIGGDVLDFQATLDGKRVVYRADEDQDESFDLFVAGTFGRGRAASLTPLDGSVRPGYVLSPSGERVVFQSQAQSLFSLRSAKTTPGPAPIELDSSTEEFPQPLVLAPDGAHLVYRTTSAGSADLVLRSVPIDGSSPPIPLHPPFPGGRGVVQFQVSPDSKFVVYRADADLNDVFELFSVPLDGSAPPVRLNPPIATGGIVFPYGISPDGELVVFRFARQANHSADLYSAAIDGSFGPQKINQALPSDRAVVEFAIAPDGRAVAYRSNALGSDRFDLFIASIKGRKPPLRRTDGEFRTHTVIRLTNLPSGRAAQGDYRFTADGTHLLYRANQFAPSRFEVFRVPSDGSSPPIQISGALVAGGSVTSFALSPDQSRVVYLADAVTNDVFELFSVPLAGGPVTRLDPLPAFADVSSYRIDPLSRRVVYQADRNADNVLELFDVPLDGSAPAERLNRSLPANGDVESDFVPLPGGRTLYRADQSTNDVLELFVSLERPVLPR